MSRGRFAIQLGFYALVMVTIAVSIYAFADAVRTPVSVDDAQIAAFEGVWAGEENFTPLGPMSFALDFRWEEDGTLHSHTAMSSETWVDLRFHKDEGGAWLLTESASLAGTGEQKYTMHPVRATGDTLYYAYAEDPEFLSCVMAADGDALYMRVNLRGQEHTRFLLSRLTGTEASALREELEANRTRSGEGDWDEIRGAAEGEDPVELRNARIRVKSDPENPQVHLALVGALRQAMEKATGMTMASYAQEMYTALQTAVELDPTLPDAHYGLAQYYLNAPPIAGGSLESAGVEAEKLRELGSPLGEVVAAQVEVRQGEQEKAEERLRALLDEHPELPAARRLYIEIAGRSGVLQ
jgi:hypothetical protein